MSKPNPPSTAPKGAGDRPRLDLAAWRPSWKVVWWILGGIVVGLLLFALVWSGGNKGDDFYRVGDAPPTAATPDYDPLPTPSPARGGETSGLEPDQRSAEIEQPADVGNEPRLVETAPPVTPAAPPPAEAPTVSEPSQPRPMAGNAPPRYPSRALRRGDSGTVLVRAAIGPDGVPTSVEVADGSGSRLLDRAAVDAVRRWRFHPAMLNGQPTVGTVVVPISFEPRR